MQSSKICSDVLVRILSRSLESHKRLVVPQLGAFLVKEPGRSVVFTELLKRDDGVLRGILLGDGLSELEAAGEIDRFVFEVRHAVAQGGECLLPGLGTMRPGPNGTIAFLYDPAAGAEECAVRPSDEAPEAASESPKTESPETAAPQPAIPDAANSDAGFRSAETQKPELSETESPEAAAPAAGAAAGSSGPDLSAACADPSPAAAELPSAASGPASSASAVPAGTPHRAASSGPGAVRPGRLSEAVRTAFDEAPMSTSAKMAPDPSVRGLRYGKPRKSTDAYTYVDRPPRRRGDRFLWIALFAAVIALGAIAFGFLRERREQRAEAEFFEQVGLPLQSLSGDGGSPAE